MTPSERDIVANTVRGLWPRTGGKMGWNSAEWSVLDEYTARIDIDANQAVAALRNLKATSKAYPQVSLIREALLRAEGSRSPRPGQAESLPPTFSRIEHMRRMLTTRDRLPEDRSNAGVVKHYWLEACWRSMRMRADIPESYERDFIADGIEVAHMSPEEAREWWTEIVAKVQHVQLDPDLAESAAAVGRLDPARAAALLGKAWDQRPLSKRRQKAREIKRRMEIHEVLAEVPA